MKTRPWLNALILIVGLGIALSFIEWTDPPMPEPKRLAHTP